MYSIFRTTSFKKDFKKLSQNDKNQVKEIILKLEEKYKDHK